MTAQDRARARQSDGDGREAGSGTSDRLRPLGGLQEWIDSGAVWRTEGSVGRGAVEAIRAGDHVLGPRTVLDYYGNRVPGRHEVTPGALGSVEYANARRAERGWPALVEMDGLMYEDGERPDDEEEPA